MHLNSLNRWQNPVDQLAGQLAVVPYTAERLVFEQFQ